MKTFSTLALTLCLVGGAQAAAAGCAVEHGYLACHLQSEQGRIVNLSFPEGQEVSTATTQATLCGEDPSGVASVELTEPEGASDSSATIANHSDGCSDVDNLRFSEQGLWTLTLHYTDGDRASTQLQVQR